MIIKFISLKATSFRISSIYLWSHSAIQASRQSAHTHSQTVRSSVIFYEDTQILNIRPFAFRMISHVQNLDYFSVTKPPFSRAVSLRLMTSKTFTYTVTISRSIIATISISSWKALVFFWSEKTHSIARVFWRGYGKSQEIGPPGSEQISDLINTCFFLNIAFGN